MFSHKESSRRDLLNDLAELRSILKKGQNTHYPRFSFTPETGIAFPKTSRVLFLLCARADGHSISYTVTSQKNR